MAHALADKRLEPLLADLPPVLREHGELIVDDHTAALLITMSAATTDTAGLGSSLARGQGPYQAGSLLTSRIAMQGPSTTRTRRGSWRWTSWVMRAATDGEFCFTAPVTDVATGWIDNRSVRNKAQVHVVAAIGDAVEHLPFPIRGIDCDIGSESLNAHL